MSEEFDAWMAAGAPGTLQQWQALRRMNVAAQRACEALQGLSAVLLQAVEPLRRFDGEIDKVAQLLEQERDELFTDETAPGDYGES